MKLLLVISAIISLSIGIGLSVSSLDETPVMDLVSYDLNSNTIFVIMPTDYAEQFAPGESVGFNTKKNGSLRGVLISKEPWFHRTMVKVRISDKQGKGKGRG